MAFKPVVQILDDDSIMSFGKYKGIKMKQVPVGYLHWMWHNLKVGNIQLQEVRDYIFRNLDALREENDDLIWDDE